MNAHFSGACKFAACFLIWSCSIFDLKFSCKSLKVQDHNADLPSVPLLKGQSLILKQKRERFYHVFLFLQKSVCNKVLEMWECPLLAFCLICEIRKLASMHNVYGPRPSLTIC